MSEDVYKKIFSENLCYYMELRGKTQADIINDLHFDKSTVSTWVLGTRLPRMDKVNALAEYLHCKRSDLIESRIRQDGKPFYVSDEAKAIAMAYDQAPEAMKDAVSKLLDVKRVVLTETDKDVSA